MASRGLDITSFPPTRGKIERIVYLLENDICVPIYARGKVYSDIDPRLYSPYDTLGTKITRNELILKQYADGVSITKLANQYGLTAQRVYQIIHSN